MSITGPLLATFPRTETTEVHLSLSSFKGRTMLDLRLYYLGPGCEWLPTRKGCTIRPEELADLIAALKQARQEVCP